MKQGTLKATLKFEIEKTVEKQMQKNYKSTVTLVSSGMEFHSDKRE